MTANKTLLMANDYPLIASPTIAKSYGIAAATVLQKLHYCLQSNDTITYQNRRYWFHSYEQWAKTLGFYSVSTIKRAITILKQVGVLLIEKLSAKKWLQTNYYSIDYQKLNELFDLSTSNLKCAVNNSTGKEPVAPAVKLRLNLKTQAQIQDFSLIDCDSQGTVTPKNPSAQSEDLSNLEIEVAQFYTVLRQLKVDIHFKDPQIKQWLPHRKKVIRHISYIKHMKAGIERYQWHTPDQLRVAEITCQNHC